MRQSTKRRKAPPRIKKPSEPNKVFWGNDPARMPKAPMDSFKTSGSNKTLKEKVKAKLLWNLPESEFSPMVARARVGQQQVLEGLYLVTSETPNELKSRLIGDPCWRNLLTERIAAHCRPKRFDALAGPAAGAYTILGDVGSRLHKRLVFIRKAKKLSEAAVKFVYYNGRSGLKALNSLKPGELIMLLEDDMMTRGTIAASIEVVREAGGVVVGIACVIEWPEFDGRNLLRGYDVFSSLKAFSSPHNAVEWWEKHGCV